MDLTLWTISWQKKEAYYYQIMKHLLYLGQQGQIKLGERLPSERVLAHHLNVNRSTVTHAFNELEDLGIVKRKKGSGTFLYELPQSSHVPIWRYFPKASLSLQNDFCIDSETLKKEKKIYDAYSGELPLDLVPNIQLPNLNWQDFLNEEKQVDLLGYLPLRKEIGKKFQQDASHIFITSGSQQALFLILQVLLHPGEKVLLFKPSFFWNLSIFQATQINRVGLPLTKEGICLSALKEKVKKEKIKVIFLNPTFQNPTGWQMSYTQRLALAEFVKEEGLLLVEDDAFQALSYPDTQRLPTLKSLAPENVLYLGSLSKVLGTTTKIGWTIGPKHLLIQLANLREQMEFNLSIFPQVLAYYALKDPTYTKQIDHLKKELKRRSDYFVTLNQNYPLGTLYPTKGGYYTFIEKMPLPITRSFFKKMKAHHLLAAPGSLFLGPENSLRVNTARLNRQQAYYFVTTLYTLLQKEQAFDKK